MACINKSLPSFKKLENVYGTVFAETLVRANTPINQEDFDIPNLKEAKAMVEKFKNDSKESALEALRSGVVNGEILRAKLKGIVSKQFKGSYYVIKGTKDQNSAIDEKLARKEILEPNLKVLNEILEQYPGIFDIVKVPRKVDTYVVNFNEEEILETSEFSTKYDVMREQYLGEEVEEKPRFNTVSNTKQISLSKTAAEQDIPQKEWDEYYELVYGKKNRQLKLFNEQNKRNTQDPKIVEKYFSESNESTDKKILEQISESSHPLAPVAKKLLKYATGAKVTLVPEVSVGYNAAGVYTPATNSIEIAQYAKFKGLGSEPTLIHEIVHAATVHFMGNNPEATTVKELKNLYEKYLQTEQAKELSDKYPLQSLEEFVVGVFTNAELIDSLMKTPATGSKTYLDALVDWFAKLFNLNTADKTLFSEIFTASIELLEDAASYDSVLDEDITFANEQAGVRYELKALNALSSPQAEKLFQTLAKNNVTGEAFWSKIQKDLNIPKNQIELMKGLTFNTSTKPGVQEVFNSNPELASIGTPEQYSQYLDTIFPDSKVKDIVYHGTDKKFETFSKNIEKVADREIPNVSTAYFFTNDLNRIRDYGKNKINALLNTKETLNFKNISNDRARVLSDITYKRAKQYTDRNIDSIIADYDLYKDYIVFEPEQIHILGSKEDIEGFKKFTSKPSVPSREDLITSLLANYSYTVEINTAKAHKPEYSGYMNEEIPQESLIEAYGEAKDNSSYYSNLTVPGGTNYTENEIATPGITPSIKGHAQFATPNGIGWFRSDDKGGDIIQATEIDTPFGMLPDKDGYVEEYKGPKTRRILEVQSDYFQKLRQRFEFNGKIYKIEIDSKTKEKIYLSLDKAGEFDKRYTASEYNKIFEDFIDVGGDNQFLALLHRGDNWVTFFVKSIIQDSARKGYEKVLFPKGDTASKIEGHTTLEQFKKQKEDRIKELEKRNFGLENKNTKIIPEQFEVGFGQYVDNRFETKEQADNFRKKNNAYHYEILDNINSKEINQLKEELKRVETEGFAALRPIYKFYEETVNNILKKQGFTPTVITDEYGNQWDEVAITPEMSSVTVLLNMVSNNPYQTTAAPETIEKVKSLLAKLNIPVENLERLSGEFSINGLADGLRRLIKIAHGLEGVALTEEAMHMITMMVPQEILQPLLDTIQDYNIYYQTLEEYGNHPLYLNDDGTTNTEKIKLEAVGKLLAEYYIMNSEGLTDDVVNISKTLKGKLKEVWANIIAWIRGPLYANVDYFQEFIQDLEEGKYDLGETITRPDILASIAFTRANSDMMAEDYTYNLDPALVGDKAAMKGNAILTKVSELINLIETVRDEDMSIVQNVIEHINLPSKKGFEYNRIKINNFKEATQLKEKVLNSIEYMRNSYYNTELLSARSNDIRKMLNTNQDENGNPLDPKVRLYLFNELSMINSVLEAYISHAKELNVIFNDESVDGTGLRNVAAETEKVASAAVESNKSITRDNLIKILDKAVETKTANYKRLVEKEIQKLAKALVGLDPSSISYAKITKKIEKLEDSIKDGNIPFSGEKLMQILESVNAADDFSAITLMNEGGMTHRDPVVQAVANLISDTTQDSMKAAAADVSALIELFRTYGKSQNIGNSAYDKFTEIVERVEFNPRTGNLDTYEDYRLISETKQWLFEDHLQVLEWLAYQASKGEDVTQEFAVRFGETITLADQEEAIKNKSKQLKETFGERRFTDKYYEIREILDNAILSDGVTTVRQARQVYVDRLVNADEQLEAASDPVTFELFMNEKNQARLDLARLESEYDLVTGEKKTGDQLLIAQTITAWKKAKKNVQMPDGSEVNVDNYFISNNAKIQWEEEKAQVDKELADAEAMYATRPSPANKLKLDEKTKNRDLWYRDNVTMEIPKEFYEERADIISGIQMILEGYKGDPMMEEAAAKNFDENWEAIFNMVKGIRDSDGTLDGTLAFSVSDKVREKEQQLVDLKNMLKEYRPKMSRGDADVLLELLDMLDQIQENVPTEYWEQTLEAVTGQVMMGMDPDATDKEIMAEVAKTDFFKDNTVDVTKQYIKTKAKYLPPGVYKVGRKYYKPIYTWREVVPKGAYQKQAVPSMRWKTYQVNPAFNNPKYETIQGKVALNKDKVAGTIYDSKRVDELSASDKEFLGKVKEFYYKDQLTKKKSARIGDSLPRIAATGLHRKTQIATSFIKTIADPRNWKFKTSSFWQKVLDLFYTTTDSEDKYGEGVNEMGSILKGNAITIANKYLNKSLPMRSQERDLFRLLSLYNIESHRVNKLRELVPALNSILKIAESTKQKRGVVKRVFNSINFTRFTNPGDTNRTKALRYEIEKRINKRNRRTNTQVSRMLNSITDNAQGGLALTRLALPHFITSSIKNSAVGAYQMWVNKSKYVTYSQASFTSAYFRAIAKAVEVNTTRLMTTPTKYTALVKHLNVVSNFDVNDTASLKKDFLLKFIDSLGYMAGSIRATSETQLELTLFEMFRAGNLVDGKDIMDLYDYENGTLKVKKQIGQVQDEKFKNFLTNVLGTDNISKYYKYVNGKFEPTSELEQGNKDLIDRYIANNQINGKDLFDYYTIENGKIEAKPVISPEKEREFTNSVKNLQQFTQGNFSADNSIYAKQFWLGRVMSFMKGFIYNPLMVRIGKKRILSTGQEVEGFYQVFFRVLFTDFRSMFNKGLTTNEKDAVRKFIKDFLVLNAIGGGYYFLEKALKESGDDDEEETLKWYLLLLYRKIYSEAAVFNAVEKVGVPARMFLDEDAKGEVREKNPIESFAMYAVGRPAMEMALASVLPIDAKGLRWDNEDINSKDPFYNDGLAIPGLDNIPLKDDWMAYNVAKMLKLKPDMFYPKSSLSAFQHFDKSVYQYKLSEGSKKKGRKSLRGGGRPKLR